MNVYQIVFEKSVWGGEEFDIDINFKAFECKKDACKAFEKCIAQLQSQYTNEHHYCRVERDDEDNMRLFEMGGRADTECHIYGYVSKLEVTPPLRRFKVSFVGYIEVDATSESDAACQVLEKGDVTTIQVKQAN